MKIASILLYIIGIAFCVVGFFGHHGAWAGAALSFFAATMVIVGLRKKI